MKGLKKCAATACVIVMVFGCGLPLAAQTVPNPTLSLTPAVYLVFSNLTEGTNYQLQISRSGLTYSQYYDLDLSSLFQAAIDNPKNYILYQEGYFATYQDYTNYIMSTDGPQLTAEATNNATVSYNASWSDAPFTVMASDTKCVVDSPALLSGSLYRLENTSTSTNTPPVFATPGVRLVSMNLSPTADYQIEFKSDVGGIWQNWAGGQFTASAVTNLQILPATNGYAFFRLQYLP